MSIRNISIYLLRTSRSNYDWKFASLYRLTSRRGYSTSADNSVETQANNIKTHDSANETITKTNESPSVNIRKSNSFANRRRPNREVNGINPSQTVKQTVPLPSSLLRTWEKSEEMLHLNFLNTDPYIRSYQNTYITKLPLTVTRRDIEMLTKGIFPDHEKIINKIFIVYNNYYKPTGSAWIQFNDSRNAVRFVKYANHKTFYGNKLNIELMDCHGI
ncbi:hypothetical protein C1645_65497 [Glomus cerebriforme]|uniref:RRM domain-containing protein n=1 Tax=Glomus cerebriforme TaxID=658196 RepID=A0A397T6I0_9GLOM|nr:hypothetical protein C1645_65497 [Glomus cerebriforme]